MRIDDIVNDVQRLSNDKQFEELPVSKDILRLARKVKVKQKQRDEEKPHLVVASSHPDATWLISDSSCDEVAPLVEQDSDETKQTANVLFHLISTMATTFQPDATPTREEFNSDVNFNDHYTLTRYLLKVFGANGAVIGLLKSCHQTIIARILHRLRDTLRQGQTGLEFKDVRGSWRIFILFDNEHMCVVHRRREEIYTKSETEFANETLFEFEWELQCNYNKTTYQVDSVQMILLEMYKKESKNVHIEKHMQTLRQCFVNCGQNIDHCFDPNNMPVKEPEKEPVKEPVAAPPRRFCTLL